MKQKIKHIKAQEWNRYPETKPTTDMLCYVANEKAGMACFIVLYQKQYDVFKIYDLKAYDHPALEVTHWIKLPDPPKPL